MLPTLDILNGPPVRKKQQTIQFFLLHTIDSLLSALHSLLETNLMQNLSSNFLTASFPSSKINAQLCQRGKDSAIRKGNLQTIFDVPVV